MIFPPRRPAVSSGSPARSPAYGPFAFGMLFAWAFGTFGGPNVIFYGLALFFALNVVMNWWMYARRGAATPADRKGAGGT